MAEPMITPQAEADLVEIYEYLAEQNEQAAERITREMHARIQSTAQAPLTGRPRDDLAPGLRSVVVRPYVIFFRPVAETIQVIRVLRGSRDVARIIGETDLDE